MKTFAVRKGFGPRAVRLLLVGVAVLCAAQPAAARTFYVDYASGDDTADGVSANTAFKHCPGDPNAKATAAATVLEGGDTVRLKGGVAYRGSVKVAWDGDAGKPIVFDGNSDGTFGEGHAVVDGSKAIPGWRPCGGPEDCGGNPNWKHIRRTAVAEELDPFSVNLYEGEEMLWVATDPNVAEPFYIDRRDSYRHIPPDGATRSTLTDAEYFTQEEPGAWDGAYVALWAQPNYTYFQRVLGYEPEAHRITYEELKAPHYENRGRYVMMNHPRVLDRPGEFVLQPTADGGTRLYLWPATDEKIDEGEVTRSVRDTGFDVDGHRHVTVRGFTIQKMLSRNPHRGAGVSSDTEGGEDIAVLDNVIRYCNKENTTWKHAGINLSGVRGGEVRGNRIYENRRIGGVYLLGGSEGITIRDNTVRQCGYVGIWLIGAPRCRIVGNTVLDNRGTHANAITVYHGSNGVKVFGNRVHNSQVALASEEIEDLTAAYNVFTSSGGYVVCNWYNSRRLTFYNNVILGPENKALMLARRGTTDCAVKNNILAGLLINEPFEVGHNLYVGHYQGFETLREHLGHAILTETDLSKIFADPEKHDYHLKPGGPAIDAGADVGLDQDAEGTAVPQGKAPDIGAFEYRATDEK